MLVRIKFTGLPDIKKVMDFCMGKNPNHEELYDGNHLMCRINEVEGRILDPDKERTG